MSTLTLHQVNFFSRVKESYESILSFLHNYEKNIWNTTFFTYKIYNPIANSKIFRTK